MSPFPHSRKGVIFLFLVFVLLGCVYFLLIRSIPITNTNSQITQSVTPKRSLWIMKPSVWSQHKILVNCKQLIKGDKEEIARAKTIMNRYPKKTISSKDFIKLTKNCDSFKNKRGYIPKALSKSEQEFPISYGIVIYKDIEQFERLLRTIYRPQNYYCVHVDLKSPKRFHRAVANIINCFPNVFVASKFVNVIWGSFAVLEAYLICLKDLLDRFKNWKYFINLSGQEFPLKTNNELVKDLKSLNGGSLVEDTSSTDSDFKKRYKYVWNGTKLTGKKKTPFGYNFQFYKGSVYVVLSRQFANFSLNNHVAKELLEWLKDTGHPDETFFSTLFGNVAFPTPIVLVERYNVVSRFVRWRNDKCYGKVVRQVCIFGVGDLTQLTNNRALFVNKLHLDYEYLALDCMEQWIYNKTYSFYIQTNFRSQPVFRWKTGI